MTEKVLPSPDQEFLEAYEGKVEALLPEQCQVNSLYYGVSRSMSDLAICRGSDMNGGILFEGWRNKSGDDHLFVETYKGPGLHGNLFVPYIALGEVPPLATSDEIMSYLLDESIMLIQAKCDWMRAMPERLKASRYWAMWLEDDQAHLESLLAVKQNGFSKLRVRALDAIHDKII